MLKELRKQSIGKGMKAVLMLLFMSVVLIALGFNDLQDIRRGLVKYDTVKPEDVTTDTFVELALTENYGSFMAQYEQRKGSTVKKTTKVCYLIGLGNPGDEDFRLVSIVVPATDEQRMDKMADNTFNGKTSEPMAFTGEFIRMGNQDKAYAELYLQELGFSSTEIKDVLLTYHLVECDWEAKTKLVYILCGSGAFFGVLAILVLLYTFSGLRMRKIIKEIKKSGYSKELVDADYANAKILVDKPTFRIGKVFTFFYVGATPHIVLNKNIVWGYYHVAVVHGKAGLKKTYYMVVLRTLDKKRYDIEVPSEGKAHYILNMINNAMPWMIIGSDDAFHKMYSKDFQGFLDIRYNKIDDKTTKKLP